MVIVWTHSESNGNLRNLSIAKNITHSHQKLGRGKSGAQECKSQVNHSFWVVHYAPCIMLKLCDANHQIWGQWEQAAPPWQKTTHSSDLIHTFMANGIPLVRPAPYSSDNFISGYSPKLRVPLKWTLFESWENIKWDMTPQFYIIPKGIFQQWQDHWEKPGLVLDLQVSNCIFPMPKMWFF